MNSNNIFNLSLSDSIINDFVTEDNNLLINCDDLLLINKFINIFSFNIIPIKNKLYHGINSLLMITNLTPI